MTKILVKIFAHGFYKVNSGFLVFLFGILLSYCLFINTAGDITLMPPGKVLYYNFIMLINFAGSPIITAIFFMGWLIYTIKSWWYVSGQLTVVYHQFLFYSIPSFSRWRQFKSWLLVQFVISLPFVFYVLIASVAGFIFQHGVMVVLIWLFTILLIAISAWIYTYQINRLIISKGSSPLLMLTHNWLKPFFSLFIYYVFNRQKLAYIITKLLSYFVIVGLFFMLADVKNDTRVAALLIAGIATAHAILIYQQHRFEELYFAISRNLPFSIYQTYLRYLFTYTLLFLPEEIWLFINFNRLKAIGLLFLLWAITLLFHTLIYKTGLVMNRYVRVVAALLFAISVFILFGWVWILIPVCLLISMRLMTRYYALF